MPLWMLHMLLVAASLVLWFWTQALIGKRAFTPGVIGDRLHDLTAGLNAHLWEHPRQANALLIVTSAIIDALGIFLIAIAIIGPTVRPFVGVILLFALRQICQGLCALPPPEGMIWRHPGFPSLLVTYGTASDLFFSGHTAIAVYGCIELAYYFGPIAGILGCIIVLVEATAVLILRAHYTMDVFAGAITALWVGSAASVIAPYVDRLLGTMAR